ncbi:MAG: ComEC/Rec2 family competence protein, partial [Lachnospiraceae bacterium]|nr:ComEC/Rec2 family competence protein [Lachnospiraceae bacterium]
MKRKLVIFCVMMILLIWITDMLWGKGWKYKPPPDLKHTTSGDTITVTGKVFQKEQKSEYQILYIYYNSYNIYHSKLMIYNKNVTEIHIGNTIEVKGKLQFFETARNPGNFDQLFYYDKQGISGSIFSENIKIVNANVNKVKDWLYQVREKWKEIFREIMGTEKAGIMSAIVLGDKSEMDMEIKELYQKNGIGHIMAISGLHISFVGIGCYRLLRKLGSSFLIAGISGFTILFLYVVMVGFNVSTLRALIMFGFRIGADIMGRVYDMMTGLLVAALIVVLWRPLSLYDAGFLLSFGAILGILIFNKWLLFLFPCKWKWCEGLYVSLSINLMIFPILIYFYFEFPMYSFFLNLLIIPLLSWLLGAGIVGTALYKVTFIFGLWLLKSCGVILDLYQVLCEWANSLPGTRIVFGQPIAWQILCYYGIVFGLFGITRINKEDEKWKKRYQKITVIAIFAAIGIFTLGHGKKGVLEVTMLDVGQGDGMFMRGPSGATYLVDGGSSDIKNVGKYRMESFLKSQGVSVIDYVFISHGDADHINGITEMLLRQGMGVKIRNI